MGQGHTHQSLVVDLLPDELVLAQGVAGLTGDGIDGALLHLLLDGAVQHEERLPRAFLWGQGVRHSQDPPTLQARRDGDLCRLLVGGKQDPAPGPKED